jgi:7tm Odorant receptor
MLLCVIGFQIVVLESLIEKVIASIFGAAIIIQMFIYSFGGQLIADKSSSVAENFYENDKDFIIIIARSQKAAKINAGFYQANLPTFSSILSSAASLITLLQSFIE